VLNGSGRPLDTNTREYMEPRFGYDMSRVLLHTDQRAARSARALNARAYILGADIVFGAGEYAPQTGHGRALMAHELAHVVQQPTAPLRLARNNGNPSLDSLLRIYVGAPTAQRAKTVVSLSEGLMARRFLDVHPGSWEAQYIIEAILKVESKRDLARVGLEYSCSGGFRNEAAVRSLYAVFPGKLKEIDSIVGSADVKAQLESVLGCEAGRQA
jgi:hypothetical protein